MEKMRVRSLNLGVRRAVEPQVIEGTGEAVEPDE